MDSNDEKLFNYLQSRLFRTRCPSTMELGEYAIGLGDSTEQQNLRNHLFNCPHCRKELTTFQEAFDVADDSASWLDRLKIWLAKPLLPESFEPVYALRGESDEPQIFSADNGVQIAINIQPDSEHIGYFSIVGMIIGAITDDFKIDIWQDGELESQTAVDETGNFNLNHLTHGTYELIVAGPDFLLHIQTFRIA